MRMKKAKQNFTVLLLCGFVVSNVQAQFFYGVHAGLNLSNAWGHWPPATGLKPGFQIGALANYSLTEKLSVEPILLFTTQRKYIKNLKDEKINYIQMPVNIRYKLGNNLYMRVGLYQGIAVSGKCTLTHYDGEKEDYKLEFGKNSSHKIFDFGFCIGVSLQFRKMQIDFGGNSSIIVNERPPSSVRYASLALSSIYLFGK